MKLTSLTGREIGERIIVVMVVTKSLGTYENFI